MIVKNGIAVSAWEDLMLQQDKFAYADPVSGRIEYDGPTMIYLIFEKIDPSTIVGFDSLLKNLETMKLGDFSNNVDTMLTRMVALYSTLYDNGQGPRHYRRYIFKALLTGPNAQFNNFITRIKDDVESGIGTNARISPDQLITACRSKYNNMVTDDL